MPTDRSLNAVFSANKFMLELMVVQQIKSILINEVAVYLQLNFVAILK